jgi:hypothetical protein
MSGDDLVAYCGLDCSACFGYTKTISEAAKALRRTMRDERIKQVWPGIIVIDSRGESRIRPGGRREPNWGDHKDRPYGTHEYVMGVWRV